MNRQEHQTLEQALQKSLRPLPLDETLRMQNSGAQLVDTRPQADFAATHLSGSINIPLGGKYATWAGTLLHKDKPIVLIVSPGEEHESAMRLGRIGFDHVAGYLEGGPATFQCRPELVVQHERITPETLQALLKGDDPPVVLDVRGPGERDQGHIEGSLHIPLGELPRRISEVPREHPIVTQCATGYRSAIAASVLQQHGIDRVTDLDGGFAAWQAIVVG